MLKLRRGVVVAAEEAAGGWQRLEAEIDGERRPAVADVTLLGPAAPGDEVVVNVEARDLALGSGGFDVVHVNLTRGLAGEGVAGAHVMKLNYTSLQHAVLPVERERLALPLARPVGVFPLHGHLAPLAWAIGQTRPGMRVGYVQTAGGALPGAMSQTVRELLERGLLADHVTAGPAFGGAREAITTAGAIHEGIAEQGWDAALVGPGPGILGSGSALGHGGMVALDSAHAALALGCRTILTARMSAGDPRERHRGLSHHTRTVLDLLLAPVVLPVPVDAAGAAADAEPAGGGLPALEDPRDPLTIALDAIRARGHEVKPAPADLEGYRASGLPTRTMGRELDEDRPFFAAALAAGRVVARS
jgi:hypothetical protein